MCRDWYKSLIKENLLDLGIAGWMADFGEYTPVEARTQFPARWWGEDHGELLHQNFPQEWAKLNREVVEEAGKKIVILSFVTVDCKASWVTFSTG